MPNKTVPKKMHVGYELRINRTGKRGSANWMRVGYVFKSKSEARQYRNREFPDVTKYSIMGINLSALPRVRETFMFAIEKKETENKKGKSNAS